jgi:hypothetical protein
MAAISLGRHLVAAATGFAVADSTAGCGAAQQTDHSSTAASSFGNDFITFRHPARWRPVSYSTADTLHFHPIVYLSSQPTRDPCHQQTSETACGWPVDSLRPGGVLIVWENRGFPGWSLASKRGPASYRRPSGQRAGEPPGRMRRDRSG